MCKNCEKKWESNETKLARDKKSGNEEFEIIQDRADAPCTSTPEHLEIVVARQPWMWREREREKLRTRNLEDRGNIVSKGLSCPRSFKLQYSLAGIAVSETTSKQTRMNLNAKWFLSPIREKCFIDSQDRREFYTFPPRRGRIVENEGERKENTRELEISTCSVEGSFASSRLPAIAGEMEKLSSGKLERRRLEMYRDWEVHGGEGCSWRASGRKFCPNILYGRMAQWTGQWPRSKNILSIFPQRGENSSASFCQPRRIHHQVNFLTRVCFYAEHSKQS